MKSKKFTKKLNLNKKTIADLNNDEMNKAHGRGPASQIVSDCSCLLTGCCPTQVTDCTCTCSPTGELNCKCAAGTIE